MSSINNSRITWRQREAEKARLVQQRKVAKTEENFPTTLAASTARIVALPGMAERILEAHIQEEVQRRVEAYRSSIEARERRSLMNGIYFNHRRRGGYQEEVEEVKQRPITHNEKWPGHGRRGTFTQPDEDGWRLVVNRLRRKRELTDEEMERKWRVDMLNDDDDEEQADYNGELTEAGQRRDFY